MPRDRAPAPSRGRRRRARRCRRPPNRGPAPVPQSDRASRRSRPAAARTTGRGGRSDATSSSRSRYSARARRRSARAASVWVRNRATAASSSPTPLPLVASVMTIGGRHSPGQRCAGRASPRSRPPSYSAPSRSALLTTKTSAIPAAPRLERLARRRRAPGTASRASVVCRADDVDLVLPDADRLDEHDIAAVGVEHQRRARTCRGREPAEVAARRERRMKHAAGPRACDCMRTRSPRMAPPL